MEYSRHFHLNYLARHGRARQFRVTLQFLLRWHGSLAMGGGTQCRTSTGEMFRVVSSVWEKFIISTKSWYLFSINSFKDSLLGPLPVVKFSDATTVLALKPQDIKLVVHTGSCFLRKAWWSFQHSLILLQKHIISTISFDILLTTLIFECSFYSNCNVIHFFGVFDSTGLWLVPNSPPHYLLQFCTIQYFVVSL